MFFGKIVGYDRRKGGMKIRHDSQTTGVFSEKSIFRKNTPEVKDLRRDPLKTT